MTNTAITQTNQQQAIIILAAGASTRLQQPKQVLPYKTKNLLQHVIDEALQTRAAVFVVVGANASMVQAQTTLANCHIVFNNRWSDGLATSLQAGLQAAQQQAPGIAAALFCVCDQPFVSAALFQAMWQQKQTTGKGIVACSYSGTLGTPVLFDAPYFGHLLQLQGDEGAKKLVQQNVADVDSVSFEAGRIDIDTAHDYQALMQQS